MSEKTSIDTSNIDPNYWEGILEQNNLGRVTFISQELKKNGLEGTSLEQAQKTEEEIKTGLDKEIEDENKYPSEAPMNKSGLLPCQRAKLENEKNITYKDPRLKSSQ